MKNYDFTQIPFDQIESVGQKSLLNKDLFCVSWLLGRYCNYSCSYCWPYASSTQKDHRSTELLKDTMREIKKQSRERGFNSFHFSFSGGEPTLHKGYLELLQHYADDTVNTNFQSLHMTSNLSPGKFWFKKYLEVTKPIDKVSITASYHHEFADREQFREKLLLLQEEGIYITINIVMVPEFFQKLWINAHYFHHAGLNVTLKPQSNSTATAVVDAYEPWMRDLMKKGLPQQIKTKFIQRKSSVRVLPTPKAKPDSAELVPKTRLGLKKSITDSFQVEMNASDGKKWYIDQAERFNAFGFNNFKDWECSAGFRSIIIREPDGSIKRSYSCADKPLGFIGKGFKLFDQPAPCISSSCVSSADSKIPKRKPGTKWPLYPSIEIMEQTGFGPPVVGR